MTRRLREPVNGLPYLIGVLLSLAALVALVAIGVPEPERAEIGLGGEQPTIKAAVAGEA
jgi:hypothetical protein